jgi:hypothetical protein
VDERGRGQEVLSVGVQDEGEEKGEGRDGAKGRGEEGGLGELGGQKMGWGFFRLLFLLGSIHETGAL